ncbi:MAG: hypothetical protein MI784_17095, partial [Cytophagales bacterium]|nr:hypothetical protein [Cytophagales bacterium]
MQEVQAFQDQVIQTISLRANQPYMFNGASSAQTSESYLPRFSVAAIPPDTSALHAKRYQLRHLKASIAKKKARLSRFLQTEQQLRKQIPQASGYAKEKLISRLQDLQKQIKAVKIDETPL